MDCVIDADAQRDADALRVAFPAVADAKLGDDDAVLQTDSVREPEAQRDAEGVIETLRVTRGEDESVSVLVLAAETLELPERDMRDPDAESDGDLEGDVDAEGVRDVVADPLCVVVGSGLLDTDADAHALVQPDEDRDVLTTALPVLETLPDREAASVTLEVRDSDAEREREAVAEVDGVADAQRESDTVAQGDAKPDGDRDDEAVADTLVDADAALAVAGADVVREAEASADAVVAFHDDVAGTLGGGGCVFVGDARPLGVTE